MTTLAGLSSGLGCSLGAPPSRLIKRAFRPFSSCQAIRGCNQLLPQHRVAAQQTYHSRASHKVQSQSSGFIADSNEPLVAVEGDTISLHFVCKDMEGNVLNSTREDDEPLTFEIGAGDIMRNQLFEAFDTAVRGLGVGDTTTLEAQGGEWKKELLFKVPIDHPEVQRLQGRYKNHGGLKESMVVELVNGGLALVVEVNEEGVTLDANNMMAGKTLQFDLEVVAIERGS